ncbi:carbohydrate kinase family protein [Actinomadura violacea]|uniref:Carbohydrate kinase n=1 Tax=Actinomadura violacea TaxID=2819934 RepID=A0ABS3S902_9ACTN|nr:carbohydrate kinase [Actinomadura violacea]MBO2465478.1 carbohydrate kinase [Actinomadura violacea]
MSDGTITVVGEAIVDLTGAADGRTYRADPGGSPANVAVGLARLGVPVTLVTGLGDDAFGRLITRHLTEADVRVAAEPAAFTGMAVVTVDDAGVPAYDFALAWEPGAVTIPTETAALHTGSLAAALGDGPAHVEALMSAARATATVSYDPNVRPAFLGDLPSERARVERQVALSDLVKASEEDLAWLYPGADPLAVARTWRAGGPALVVITHGARGATVIGAGGTVHRPAPVVTVADTVGAGDAFMAALLAGLASEDLLGAHRRDALAAAQTPALARLLERAVLAAALTCTRPGADPPTIAELDDTGPAQVG